GHDQSERARQKLLLTAHVRPTNRGNVATWAAPAMCCPPPARPHPLHPSPATRIALARFGASNTNNCFDGTPMQEGYPENRSPKRYIPKAVRAPIGESDSPCQKSACRRSRASCLV